MASREAEFLAGLVINFFINLVMILLVVMPFTTLCLTAFLLSRYQQGDEPPEKRFIIACWFTLGTSLVSILLCVIAPYVRTLSKIRWLFWIISFGLWLTGLFFLYDGINETKSMEDRYCEITRIPHCNQVRTLPKICIFVMVMIIWHSAEFCCCGRTLDSRPFKWDHGLRMRIPRQRDPEGGVRLEPPPTYAPPMDAPLPMYETAPGPPEPKENTPVGAGAIPGPPEPIHPR